MKKGLIFLTALLSVLLPLFERGVGSQESSRVFEELRPLKIRAAAFGVSPEIRSLPTAVPDQKVKNGKLGKAESAAREIQNKIPYRKEIEGIAGDADGSPARISEIAMPAPDVSFDGISSNDNAAAFGFRVFPPDTIGDVGPNHFVQAVNTLFRVYDKQGVPQTPPLKISSLFTSLGTACANRDDGDPLIVYDTLADRWIISQFCKFAPPFRQMIAVSKNGDPTGSYYIYEFVMPNVKLNDYSKFGVWHDAFYMSTDEFFGGDYAGAGAFAFDREKMLGGDPSASYIYFDLASPTTLRIGGLLPVDLDGLNAPPPNAPGMFVGYTATEYGDPQDAIRIFEFRPNFENPFYSTFSEAAASPFTVAAFDPTSPVGRNDIKQPPPGDDLDSQSDRLMYRAAYRNLGSSESVVVNQTVRSSAPGEVYQGGVRIYQFTRPPGDIFSVAEQSTYGSADTSRFMGAAAQDHEGNIAFGYSRSSSEKMPAIVYSGRLANEPAGVFRAEAELVAGTGVQTAFGFRWGDYSGLVSDPADGCSFWITNQYYSLESQDESPFGWLTRIGRFRFSECTNEARANIDVNVRNDSNNEVIENARVRVFLNGDLDSVPFERVSKTDGSIDRVTTPAGTHRVVVSAQGFLSRSYDITVITQPNTGFFLGARLMPTAVVVDSGIEITGESCSQNGTIEPTETVAVDVSLRNAGLLNTNALNAVLLAGSGIDNPGPAQNYGILTTAGESVTRNFTFTVNSVVACGDEIELIFQLQDGAQDLGTVTIPVTAGIRNVVFTENFDGVQAPSLPAGWTTSFEGQRENWTTSTVRSQSGSNAAFSPAPRFIGVNQLESPPIQIETSEAELSFRNWYELETTFLRNRVYDGAVLEIKIGANDWQDILDAGGSFRTGGYNDGAIDGCCSNPLMGRRAWSGRSGIEPTSVFIDSIVRLPAAAAGNTVKFRWRVATDNGTFKEGQYIDDIAVTDGFRCDCTSAPNNTAPFDFDGDGVTDRSLYRPSDNPGEPDFRIVQSSDNGLNSVSWGSVGDIAVNSDYDGDGRADIAVFRPSTRTWFVLQSSDGLFRAFDFGLSGDINAPLDYDGDGKADAAVYRPTEGIWYILRSSDGQASIVRFGLDGDIPVPADYDGDSADDIALYRPSTGIWYILGSSSGFLAYRFGISGDKPVAGDFDGDGTADIVLYRPSEGNWYMLRSQTGFGVVRFGLENDAPLQVDFDGDGIADVALYRPSTGTWYYFASSNGSVGIHIFGTSEDQAVPGIYIR